MTLISLLSGSHRRTYQTLFQHPIAHNLGWHEVYALFRQLGQVEEQANGSLKITRNGQLLVLHPPRTKDVAGADELMALRQFINRSEPVQPAPAGTAGDWLLVIDHHEARIYRAEAKGTIPQQILPHEPDDYFRHTHNSKDFSRGKEKPDPNSFFAPVAMALQAAGRILIFGRGTGMSSEMDQFEAWMKKHQPELARRIIGSQIVDDHHLTEAQLLAQARESFANHRATAT